jgi:1,4-dihydroxy-2-naphthoyl-CoA hydrolase
LNGGVSAALAETVASTAANFCVDQSIAYCVGLDINANHLRPATEGFVTAIAKPIHLGNKTQVWEIKIENPEGKLVCISRMTMAVVNR